MREHWAPLFFVTSTQNSGYISNLNIKNDTNLLNRNTNKHAKNKTTSPP